MYLKRIFRPMVKQARRRARHGSVDALPKAAMAA